MTERGVAETLGAHVALSSPTAELWLEVAHGELSPDEAAATELAGRAEVSDHEREEVERAKLVFAPVTEERRAALLEQLLAQRRADEDLVSLDDRRARAEARPGRGWVAGTVALVAAIAAMLLLWVLLPGSSERFVGEYGLEISGMTAGTRSTGTQEPEPGKIPAFTLVGTIHVTLKPEENVPGPIEVVGFARSESGEVRPLSLEREVHASGRVDVEVPASALGQLGTWELVFAVGRPDELPRSWDELEDGAAGYQVLRREVRVMSKPQRSEH
jgi:hypothetical protein